MLPKNRRKANGRGAQGTRVCGVRDEIEFSLSHGYRSFLSNENVDSHEKNMPNTVFISFLREGFQQY